MAKKPREVSPKNRSNALKSFEPPHVGSKRNLVRDMQVMEAIADEAKVLELTSVTAEELAAVKKNPPKFLSTEEKLAILEMHTRGISTEVITARLARSESTIRKFLSDYKPTTMVAKAYFEAHAEKLAARIVKHADVDQSMEVMDRLDVLNKKQKDSGDHRTQFQVIVGMPGTSSGGVSIPVPTQADIEIAQKDIKSP